MPEIALRNLEADQSKFNDEQLKAVDALHYANPDEVDMPTARSLGLIVDETRIKIEKAIPNHVMKFEAALARERRSSPPEEAFRKAFQAIYGIFVMEQGAEGLSGSSGLLMGSLNDVLANSIGPTGLKRRPELQSATHQLHLRMLASGPGGEDEVKSILDEAYKTSTTSVERKGLERTYESAKHDHEHLKASSVFLTSEAERQKLELVHNELETLLKESGKGVEGESFRTRKHRLAGELEVLRKTETKYPTEGQIAARVNERFINSKHLVQREFDELVKKRAADSSDTRTDEDLQNLAEMNVRQEIRKLVEKEIIRSQMEKGRELGMISRPHDQLVEAEKVSRTLYEVLKTYFEKMKTSLEEKVSFKDVGTGAELDIESLHRKFNEINLGSEDFDPKNLLAISEKLVHFFENGNNRDALAQSFDACLAETDKAVTEAKRKIDNAALDKQKVSKLSDAEAADRILKVMVARQFPDMSEHEREKMAVLIRTSDVLLLSNQASYADLARRGSAELFDAVAAVGFRDKVIQVLYKLGEKAGKPLPEGIKPEDFQNWAKIERLFNNKVLNHQNGFIVLAGLELFEGGPESAQAGKVEAKLKELLAAELGAKGRLGESGVAKIVEDAFREQLQIARSFVQGESDYFAKNSPVQMEAKAHELDIRYEILNRQLRLKEIRKEIYELRMKKLIEEAADWGVTKLVKFSEDPILAGYWNHHTSQWLRDRGHDVSMFALRKAGAVGLGVLGFAGRTTVKLGGLAVNTMLAPVRLLKYPFVLTAALGIGFSNLFRRQKYQPFRVRDIVANDIGRTVKYFGRLTGIAHEGEAARETLFKKAWGAAAYKKTDYKDRAKPTEALEKEADELKASAEGRKFEKAELPYIDLGAYKHQIEELNRIVKGSVPGNTNSAAAESHAA